MKLKLFIRAIYAKLLRRLAKKRIQKSGYLSVPEKSDTHTNTEICQDCFQRIIDIGKDDGNGKQTEYVCVKCNSRILRDDKEGLFCAECGEETSNVPECENCGSPASPCSPVLRITGEWAKRMANLHMFPCKEPVFEVEAEKDGIYMSYESGHDYDVDGFTYENERKLWPLNKANAPVHQKRRVHEIKCETCHSILIYDGVLPEPWVKFEDGTYLCSVECLNKRRSNAFYQTIPVANVSVDGQVVAKPEMNTKWCQCGKPFDGAGNTCPSCSNFPMNRNLRISGDTE